MYDMAQIPRDVFFGKAWKSEAYDYSKRGDIKDERDE
jgi:hypothetical protein